ncbi:MAG TPA: hypothetical protein VKX16_16515, partial [Chloroflexota bacterium]|nr:hypothetical protein [Chloroflexota bacterium]
EAAAFADDVGSLQFATGKFASGLSDVQLAARDAGYEPTYREDLGHALLTLARVQSTNPNLITLPGSPDPRSVSPDTALQLVPSQLRQFGLDQLRAAISLAPLDPSTYETLGTTYLGLNQPAAAYQEFRHAAQLSANNPTYIADESLAEGASHRALPALTDAQTAVALDPIYWLPRLALASALHALGSHVDARQEAALGLSLTTLAYTPPPATQIDELRRLAKTG